MRNAKALQFIKMNSKLLSGDPGVIVLVAKIKSILNLYLAVNRVKSSVKGYVLSNYVINLYRLSEVWIELMKFLAAQTL